MEAEVISSNYTESVDRKLDGLIEMFVHKDPRNSMHEAMTIGDFTYASDAYSLLKIPNFNCERFYPEASRHPDFESVIPIPRLEKVICITAAALSEVLQKVSMVDGSIECSECDGEGEQECDLGHMHKCIDCRGSGTLPDPGGKKVRSSEEYIKVLNSYFSVFLIERLEQAMLKLNMDSCYLVSAHENKPHLFSLGVCDILLMALWDRDETLIAHTLMT